MDIVTEAKDRVFQSKLHFPIQGNQRKDIHPDPLMNIPFSFIKIDGGCSISPNPRKEEVEVRLCCHVLHKILFPKMLLGHSQKTLVIFIGHCQINIVVPGDESLMSDCSQKCSAAEIIPDILFIACFRDIL